MKYTAITFKKHGLCTSLHAGIRVYVYKMICINSLITSFIGLSSQIKNVNNIYSKFIMLTDNNQIFRNWFVIIHRHLTKVSAQIIQCIIFGRNELSITLSTLWSCVIAYLFVEPVCLARASKDK